MKMTNENLITIDLNNNYKTLFESYKNNKLILNEKDKYELLKHTFNTYIDDYKNNLKKYSTDIDKNVDLSFLKMKEIFEMMHGSYSNYSLKNVKNMCFLLNKNKNDTTKNITITTTTCKRLDLFKNTVNSFIECCQDLHLIKEWIVIDDNSSEEQKKEMLEIYPFITFIFKNENDKGHVKSMNIIKNLVKTKYLFNLEDDWEFFYKDYYLTKCIEIINLKPQYGQCLINKNYGEGNSCFETVGGIICSYNKNNVQNYYFEHKHILDNYQAQIELQNYIYIRNNTTQFRSQYYWPHFSLRVGLTKMSVINEIGDFENVTHFELNYANKYYSKNYVTTFLDGIYCSHIGRRTYDRFDKTKKNAYDLNKVNQFDNNINNENKLKENENNKLKENENNKLKESENNKLKENENNKLKESENNKLKESENILKESENILKENENILKESENRLKENENNTIKNINNNEISDNNSLNNIFKTFVINMKRRPDRLNDFYNKNKHILKLLNVEVEEAVDGNNIVLNQKIRKIFHTSDALFRKGIMGCAFSHMKLWGKLINENNHDMYLILEDDVLLSKSTESFLNHITKEILKMIPEWDVLFLGNHIKKERENMDKNKVSIEKYNPDKFMEYSYGGTFCYLIHKRGAIKLLSNLIANGMNYAIDWDMCRLDDMNNYFMYPLLAFSQMANDLPDNDSDIQKSKSRFNSSVYDWILDDVKKMIDITSNKGILYFERDGWNNFIYNKYEFDVNSNIIISNDLVNKNLLFSHICFTQIWYDNSKIIKELLTKIIEENIPLYFYTIYERYLVTVPESLYNKYDDIKKNFSFINKIDFEYII
jgi:GR25 family glycosyltransferase involved in LPS biosynthesis